MLQSFAARLCLLLALAGLQISAGCASFGTPDPDACPENLSSPIQNFCEVTPGTLWRGAKPDETGAAWLVRQNVGTMAARMQSNRRWRTCSAIGFLV